MQYDMHSINRSFVPKINQLYIFSMNNNCWKSVFSCDALFYFIFKHCMLFMCIISGNHAQDFTKQLKYISVYRQKLVEGNFKLYYQCPKLFYISVDYVMYNKFIVHTQGCTNFYLFFRFCLKSCFQMYYAIY